MVHFRLFNFKDVSSDTIGKQCLFRELYNNETIGHFLGTVKLSKNDDLEIHVFNGDEHEVYTETNMYLTDTLYYIILDEIIL